MTSEQLIKAAVSSSVHAARQISDVAKLPQSQWSSSQFDQIALWLREANCAVTELQNRAKGNKPPKIGD